MLILVFVFTSHSPIWLWIKIKINQIFGFADAVSTNVDQLLGNLVTRDL